MSYGITLLNQAHLARESGPTQIQTSIADAIKIGTSITNVPIVTVGESMGDLFLNSLKIVPEDSPQKNDFYDVDFSWKGLTYFIFSGLEAKKVK